MPIQFECSDCDFKSDDPEDFNWDDGCSFGKCLDCVARHNRDMACYVSPKAGVYIRSEYGLGCYVPNATPEDWREDR